MEDKNLAVDMTVTAPVMFWGIKSKTSGLTYSCDVAEKAVEQINKGMLASFSAKLDVKYVVAWVNDAKIVGNSVRCNITLTDNAPDEVKEAWSLNHLGFTLVMDVDRTSTTDDLVCPEHISDYSHIYIYSLTVPKKSKGGIIL